MAATWVPAWCFNNGYHLSSSDRRHDATSELCAEYAKSYKPGFVRAYRHTAGPIAWDNRSHILKHELQHMNTLLLDVGLWDLTLDARGNIALAAEPYALAQDVASACRTVLGEVYYDTTLGVNYFGQIFGLTPPAAVFQEMFVAAALTVPDVVSATCNIEAYDPVTRLATGQVLFTDSSHQTQTVGL
jgi:hypothetical protein